MNILKFTIAILILCTGVKAQNSLPAVAEKVYEEEMSLEMCGSLGRRYDVGSNACIYCAHGFTYDPKKSKCTGIPDVLGKCFGEHHYHAKTQECMYCAKGYKFNEDFKECMDQEELNKKGE